jgi:hypothetical protein
MKEIWMERADNHFVLGSTAYRRPDPRKTAHDGVRVPLVRGEPATTISDLPLGDMYLPENQKVVLHCQLRFLTGQACAAFYGEILPT